MAADDAADLIVEIDQERRGRILALLPPAQRRQIEVLLGYNPSTAGGLMSPDFIGLAAGRFGRRRRWTGCAPATLAPGR